MTWPIGALLFALGNWLGFTVGSMLNRKLHAANEERILILRRQVQYLLDQDEHDD